MNKTVDRIAVVMIFLGFVVLGAAITYGILATTVIQ